MKNAAVRGGEMKVREGKKGPAAYRRQFKAKKKAKGKRSRWEKKVGT